MELLESIRDKVALDRETIYYFQKARWMDTIRQELEKEEKSLSFLHLSAIRSQKAKQKNLSNIESTENHLLQKEYF